jgi:integrase
MANREGHRRFGNIRRRESGRYQVRYPGPDGRLRSAPQTFARKSDAERYLTMVEAQMLRGEWTDPVRGTVLLADYAEAWIAQRPNLRPRTVDLYRWLLGRYVAPHLGGVPLGKLDTPMVREWRAKLLASGVSETMAAKAYRLLRAVLMTAVDEDGILQRNPCRIRGAQDERPAERPVLTVPQVFALADAMADRRFRGLVLLVTFASLRWGEVTALRRRDLDLGRGTVHVRAAFVERSSGELVLGPPKSRAGVRTVSLPAAVLPALREHLAAYVPDDPDALVFTGATGKPLRRSNFNKASRWRRACAQVGVLGLHFHDLRHTGNTLAARTGASLKDLMARMGHDSVRAAIIYQHATSEADRAIADALSAHVEEARRATDDTDQDGRDEVSAGAATPSG